LDFVKHRMILSGPRTTAALALALATSLAAAGALRAQSPSGPDFSDLREGAGQEQLQAVIRSLVQRVAELERRVNALEGAAGATGSSTAAPPRALDAETRQLLDRATARRDQLQGFLDGHSLADRIDSRHVYYKVKRDASWDAVTAAARAFVETMNALGPRGAGFPADARRSLESLIRWGRGRILYQTRRGGLDALDVKLLPVDFAPDLVPVDPPAGRR
jgi:hypothetical protein